MTYPLRWKEKILKSFRFYFKELKMRNQSTIECYTFLWDINTVITSTIYILFKTH